MKIGLKALAAFGCAELIWEVLLECLVVRMPNPRVVPVLGRVPYYGLVVNGEEGFAITRFNRLGMRREDENLAPTPGEWRLLALGDSYTEAIHVGDSQTFCARLERLLQARSRQ